MKLPPLILIHGYPFDHTMWERVTAILGNKTQVLTPDLPGFGDNPARGDEPSIDAMADDMAELLKLHNLAQAVVAGMSMGGYVALSFAERHAGQLAGLGLISTQAAADANETRKRREEMIKKVTSEGAEAAANAITPKLFSKANTGHATLGAYAMRGAQKAGVKGICWALQAMAKRPDRSAVLKKIDCPILVLHGVEDQIIPAERARQLSVANPNSKYIEVRGAGHATPLEAPDDLIE